MFARSYQFGIAFLVAGAGLWRTAAYGQQTEPPPVPQGVEVQARGPVHEAFASLTAEAEPTKPIPKKPPEPLNEMPPEDKPAGDAVWIGGYWAWDDERSDFLWVSGTWRTLPPGRTWVAGYWRDDAANWRWVPGFWAEAPKGEAESHDVTYLAQPPAPPEVAAPPKPEAVEAFFVPGHWVWDGAEYRWKAGYWARVEPGYVWVNAHYRWTPSGYIYVAGYWDLAVSRRGILYAPVIIRPGIVTVGYVYTPYYAVRDTVVLDALFVRPCYCHYYFGDYYGPVYRDYGFETCVVYSRRRYDSIIVYESWERRSDPTWLTVQINLGNDRFAGRAPVPPRTLVQQTNIVNITNVNVYKGAVLASPAQVAREKGTTVVRLDITTRREAQRQAVNVREVSVAARTRAEVPLRPGERPTAHAVTMSVARTQPVKPGFVASKAPVVTARPANHTPPPATHTAPTTAATHPTTGNPPPGHPTTGTAPPTHPTGPPTSGHNPATAPPGTHPTTGQHPPATHPGNMPPGSHPPGTKPPTTPPGTAPPGSGTPPPGSSGGTKPMPPQPPQ